MKKQIFSLMLCLSMLLSLGTVSVSAATPGLHHFTKTQTYTEGSFTDVPADSTFATNVRTAYEYGIMNGSSANTFGLKDNITRLAAVIIACRLHCIYHSGVNDIDEKYSYLDELSLRYTQYANDNKIFVPDGNIRLTATRAEFAAILSSALPDQALRPINTVEDNAIPDVLTGSPNGEAIYRLYRAGIITGSDEKGTFYPNSNITRGAACAIATRMVDSALRQQVTLNSRIPLCSPGGVGVSALSLTLDSRDAAVVVSFFADEDHIYNDNLIAFAETQNKNIADISWGEWHDWESEDGVEFMLPLIITPIGKGTTTILVGPDHDPAVRCEISVTVK